ncbi:exonuclease domain-containing protein [Promicromonospora sp. NPDC090134]|uniref:3'-5' exonuclease n=1 Tax=Promicromonospora sp. NPDC090134 TaxID=3364408 RepID=UPI0038206268
MTRDDAWSAADYVVVDVEGSGAQPPQLVELALVPVHQGGIRSARTWLVRPPEPITWQARRVHGISNDDVTDAPRAEEVAEEVLEALGDSILVGHAVHVDVAVLSRALPGWAVPDMIDTPRLARRAFDLPSYSLSSLVRHRRLDAGMPPGMRLHRAGYDATVTARLFVDLASTMTPGGATRDALLSTGGPARSPAQPATAHDADQTIFDLFRPLTAP